ncbi:hypothetical protein VTJ49DRAFT_595 [Mycothermus thermophilus]|uniref:Protamine P1 n=1 Tax=Humicola insolens TaxID=85995 RepID=A0ABR3VEX0_HUMIN
MKRIIYGDPHRDFLHPDNFNNEPLYCEAHHEPDDIVYHGSDDEAYDDPAERRFRYELHARRFLEGKSPFILSASLRGPFDKASGWVNPWLRPKSSTSRTEQSRKRRRVDSGRDVEGPEGPEFSHAVYSSSQHDLLPRPDDHVPLYLDTDTFRMISSWRDQVVAESSQPSFPAADAPEPKTASPGSIHATQYTVGRHLGSTRSHISSRDNARVSTPRVVVVDEDPAEAVDAAPQSPCAARAVKRKLAPPVVKTSVDTKAVTSTASETLRAPEAVATPSADAQVPAPPALLQVQTSAKTDGSFRYQRQERRKQGSSLVNGQVPGTRISPEPAAEPAKAPEPTNVEDAAVVPPASNPVQVPVASSHETPEQVPQPNIILTAGSAGERAGEETHGDAASESQTDGPTLVASRSPSPSELPTQPSFGHFSCENQSQDVIPEAESLPRKLLWPKSRKQENTTESQPSSLGLESSHTPSFRQPENDISVGADGPTVEEAASTGHALRLAEQTNGASEPEVQPSVKLEQPAEAEATVAEPAVAEAESETASEAEEDEEDIPGTETLQNDALASPDSREPTVPAIDQETPSAAAEAQSPWAGEDIVEALANAVPLQKPSMVEKGSSPLAVQSPWTAGEADLIPGGPVVPEHATPCPAAAKLPLPGDQFLLGQAAVQSPWARGDSQLQAPNIRLFNPLSSPANSHVLPAADSATQSPAPHHENEDICDAPRLSLQPSTPTRKKQSGLPSPDFTLSVKSFKDFMTPSPQQPAKRRRVSSFFADDHLPSTQLLQEVATSNPWAAAASAAKPKAKRLKKTKQAQSEQPKPKPKKRVSWGPLPGEDDESDSSPVDSIISEPHPSTIHRSRSPPPSILTTSDLPAANQKFGKHFAAAVAAGRRIGTTPLRVAPPPQAVAPSATTTTKTTPRPARKPSQRLLLPSESQQVCRSPGVGEMAEAFLRADAVSAAAAAAGGHSSQNDEEKRVEEKRAEEEQRPTQGETPQTLGRGDGDGDADVREEPEAGKAETETHQAEQGEEDEDDDEEEEGDESEEEPVIDEVSAVLSNLDDFLGQTWDLDAELAKQARENGGGVQSSSSSATATVGGDGGAPMGLSNGFSGLAGLSVGVGLDSGVWD